MIIFAQLQILVNGPDNIFGTQMGVMMGCIDLMSSLFVVWKEGGVNENTIMDAKSKILDAVDARTEVGMKKLKEVLGGNNAKDNE